MNTARTVNLFKYLSPDRIDILEHGLIRFTQPASFNDPFEMNPHIQAIASDEYIERRATEESELHILKAYHQQPLSFRRHFSLEEFKKKFNMPRLIEQVKKTAGEEALDQVRKSVPEAINKAIGILCLTETPHNLLMWAHYANSHSGLVLEFDTRHEFFNQRFPKGKGASPGNFDEELEKEYGHLRKVEYSEQRPQLLLSDVKSFNPFLTKSIEWRYEEEWRMLMPLARADQTQTIREEDLPIYLFAIPRSAITKIIFGFRASASLENSVKAIINSNPDATQIALERVVLDPQEYKLHRIPVL